MTAGKGAVSWRKCRKTGGARPAVGAAKLAKQQAADPTLLCCMTFFAMHVFQKPILVLVIKN
jgi:hypothetical protein